MKPKAEDIKIKPVLRIVCQKCGELQVKIYPWSSINFNGQVPYCQKCLKRTLKSGVVQ